MARALAELGQPAPQPSVMAQALLGVEQNPAHPPEWWNRGVRNVAGGLAGGLADMLSFPKQYMESYQPGQSVRDNPAAADWAAGTALNMVGAPALTGGVPMSALGSSARGPVIWRTVDGGALTEPESAFRLAREMAEQAGLKIHGASDQSRSTYYQLPGSNRVLRISDHPNYHPGRNSGEVIEARLRTKRDEVENSWTDPKEGLIVEREYRNGILDTPDEITERMRQAIAEYLRR